VVKSGRKKEEIAFPGEKSNWNLTYIRPARISCNVLWLVY